MCTAALWKNEVDEWHLGCSWKAGWEGVQHGDGDAGWRLEFELVLGFGLRGQGEGEG